MCDCCDDYYCGGCSGNGGADDSGLYNITPYAYATSTAIAGGSTYVTLAEAKQHCRVDIDDDDALIQAYLDAALDYVQTRTGTSLTTRLHAVGYTSFPENGRPIVPPFRGFSPAAAPQITDNRISYADTSNNPKTLTFSTDFVSRTDASDPAPFFPLPTGSEWPDDFAFTDTSGYIVLSYYTSPSGVYTQAGPQLKVAVLMLTAHWYTAREPVTTGLNASNNKVPYTIDILLSNNTEITF